MSGSPSNAFITQGQTKASSRAGSDAFNTLGNTMERKRQSVPASLPTLDLISRKTDDNRGKLDKLGGSSSKGHPLTSKSNVKVTLQNKKLAEQLQPTAAGT